MKFLAASAFVGLFAVVAMAASKPKTVTITQIDKVCVEKVCFTGAELIKLDKALKDLRLKAIGR